MSHVTVIEAVILTGLTFETIQTYEREGLIEKPIENLAGQPLYSADDIDTLLKVKRLRKSGWTLNKCKRHLIKKDPTTLLKQQLVDVNNQIAELQSRAIKIQKMIDSQN